MNGAQLRFTPAEATKREGSRPLAKNIFVQLIQTPLTGLSRIASKINSLWISATYPFHSIGKKVWFHHSCELARNTAAHMAIGDWVMLKRNVWLNIPDSANGDEPIIILENRCNIGPGCVISAQNKIHIGENSVFGPSVFLTDHNHEFEDVTVPILDQGTTSGGKIRIGRNCWFGNGAAIVCSEGTLELGDHCVVGANAVVTKSFPAYSVIVGNPARVVRQFDPVRQVWVKWEAVLANLAHPSKSAGR
jgi:acetyltransferase-like isoleucine patch superfamily enzyme